MHASAVACLTVRLDLVANGRFCKLASPYQAGKCMGTYSALHIMTSSGEVCMCYLQASPIKLLQVDRLSTASSSLAPNQDATKSLTGRKSKKRPRRSRGENGKGCGRMGGNNDAETMTHSAIHCRQVGCQTANTHSTNQW